MPYIAALDGIRAIAVLMVVVFHAKAPFLWGGYFGVDVFFVLSGFLITSLLQAEIARTGRINLKRFYSDMLHYMLSNLSLATSSSKRCA